MTLLTADNQANLEPNFVIKRSQSLTSAEVRVLLKAEWEEIEEAEQFLPSMDMWDLCEETLPKYSRTEPMVIALDAPAGTNEAGKASTFGMVGVTRHPSRHDDIAVRYVQKWEVPVGGVLDFGKKNGPEQTLRQLLKMFNVVQVCYDPTQLHDIATRLNNENLAWFFLFNQGNRRLTSDRQLLDLIIQRRIAHKGQPDLRQHIANANRKLADDGRRLRIVKREAGLNNDLAVCLSMASYEILRLNV
jgi:CheY-like chemotaxis protein